MNITLDGATIQSEAEFHKILAEKLALSSFYGRNLDALWDVLSTDIERPVLLTWENSNISSRAMGPSFKKIVHIFERVKSQDSDWKLIDRFDFQLR